MRIAIDGTSCQLLKDLLSQDRDGLSRLLWKKYDYQLPEKYRTDAAVPLLNQLDDDPKRLHINGHQRDLLLQLLAWAARSEVPPTLFEKGPAKKLLEKLQPEGTPLEAEVGDFLVIKQSGLLVEIVHFDGGFYYTAEDAYFVTVDSCSFILSETNGTPPPDGAEWPFIDCRNLDDLMWPARMSDEAIIWGPRPYRLAA